MDGTGELLASLERLNQELNNTEATQGRIRESLQQRKEANERDRAFGAKYEAIISQIESTRRESHKRIEEVRTRCASRRILCTKKTEEQEELTRQLQALRKRLLELQQTHAAEQLSRLKRQRIQELSQRAQREQYRLIGLASTVVLVAILLYIILSL